MPVCIKCGLETAGGSKDPTQDNSTFICEKCQNKVNVHVWKNELKKYGTDEVGLRLKRKNFLLDKLKKTEG